MHFVWQWYHSALAGVILASLIGYGIWYFTRPLPTSPDSPELPLPLEPIHLQFKALYAFNPLSKTLKDQSDEWRESMRKAGALLNESGVRRIYLLHGTFVGSDPVNVMSSLRTYFPRLSGHIEKGMSAGMRQLIDHVAQDNGNFIPAYADLLEVALDAKISVKLQYWSSGNHHLARLEGALSLLERIAEDFPQKAADRILLVGHSHARQVFALFTHLINGASAKSGLGLSLWKFLEEEKLASEALKVKARALKRQRFDFVTLGGPVRYRWAFIPDMRVLHIVNHQGETSSVLSTWSFWNTGAGDFVQQWGMIGSDNLAVTPRERTRNRYLDELLGKGWHTRLWLQSMVRRDRLGDFGRTLLIDYQLAATRTNFIKTVFGHGVYTRFDVMQFQIELITKYIYLRPNDKNEI